MMVMHGVYDGGVQEQTISLNPDESFKTNSWPMGGIVCYSKTEGTFLMSDPGKYQLHVQIKIQINGKEQTLTSNSMVVLIDK